VPVTATAETRTFFVFSKCLQKRKQKPSEPCTTELIFGGVVIILSLQSCLEFILLYCYFGFTKKVEWVCAFTALVGFASTNIDLDLKNFVFVKGLLTLLGQLFKFYGTVNRDYRHEIILSIAILIINLKNSSHCPKTFWTLQKYFPFL